MSDQKKYERIMGDQVNQKVKRTREEEISAEARRHFNRPAHVCEICGKSMSINPENGKNHVPTQWELKWSIHRYCGEMMQDQLDRRTGIVSERKR